ncbi:hypothetical protein X777_14231 [Ooceraea biroi]|uniref:Uncharacterized protein n=1 Tax=Ooceraea biroi TaxID=2015173 RepID=A0A026VX45_OOCBI|nr:hypothetical protein X777_14231 [Ooceraea biroi]
MAQNPFATLKSAIEAVPFFDDRNIPLSYFVEGCEEAKSMLPSEAESQFTKIVRTRIVGEIRRTIQGQKFDTVAKLTKYLKQIYGSSKNAYQLQGELGNIYQKSEEDVVTCANRLHTGSKIDYADGYLEISDMKIPFFSPETIVPPRSESSFYIRLQNPDVKIGYLPNIDLTQGIYLGDTIVDNVNGKAHLPIISTLDKEVKIRVPILRIIPLSDYLDDLLADLSNEQMNNQEKEGNTEMASTEDYDKGKQEYFIKTSDNSLTGEFNNSGEGSFQTSPKELSSSDNSLIEEFNISGEGSVQTSPKDINYLGISEDYPPSIQYSCPVECDEGSYQTSLDTTSSMEKLKVNTNIKPKDENSETRKRRNKDREVIVTSRAP